MGGVPGPPHNTTLGPQRKVHPGLPGRVDVWHAYIMNIINVLLDIVLHPQHGEHDARVQYYFVRNRLQEYAELRNDRERETGGDVPSVVEG